MAKSKASEIIKMQSEESSHYYTRKKNKKNTPDPMRKRMYDPTLRRHAWYKEKRISK